MSVDDSRVRSSPFFTPKEAAAYLGINLRTFYKWLGQKKKGVPCRRLGPNCIRIPRAKFIKWAEAED